MDSIADQKRKHFRIPYPLQYRPKITFNHKDFFPVIDLSEHGVRFEIPDDETFAYNDPCLLTVFIEDKPRILSGVLAMSQSGCLVFNLPSDVAGLSVAGVTKISIFGKAFTEFSMKSDHIDFAKASEEVLEVLPEIRGEIIFKNKESFEIAGKIIRVMGKETVLFLSLSIPFQKIMREQIELRRRFAGFT